MNETIKDEDRGIKRKYDEPPPENSDLSSLFEQKDSNLDDNDADNMSTHSKLNKFNDCIDISNVFKSKSAKNVNIPAASIQKEC